MIRKLARAVRYALFVDKVTILVYNGNYREVLSLNYLDYEDIREWKLSLLIAECFLGIGKLEESNKYVDDLSKNFFNGNYNSDEKKYVSIYIRKKFQHTTNEMRSFFSKNGMNIEFNDNNIGREVKKYFPLIEEDRA